CKGKGAPCTRLMYDCCHGSCSSSKGRCG
uniref:Omega-conotoxin-like CnVIIH n=2 Tax=Conus consors TaxID=101297 RepID=O17H_CONCN|nr:RecName: Full=Omega-conotoxin-like CnVIIH; Contains: RecName: Full=Omega-conotoxin CnVIIA [Conus consors]